MSKAIKILILEDVQSDIFLIERQLKINNLNYTLKQTDNKKGFIDYLTSFEPDIILSDYNLPGFNGLDALSIIIKHPIYIPFIIITGALDDETAVSCIKAGADDYLTKEKLTRLVSAIESAIDKRNAINEKEKAEKETKQLAGEIQSLMQTVNTPIFGIDINGNINEWNKATEKITNYTKRNALGKNFITEFIHKTQKEHVSQIIEHVIEGRETANFEILLTGKQTTHKLLLNTTTHKGESGEVKGVILIGQDISKIVDYREELEQKIDERTKELRAALENERELSELKSRFVSMASHEFRTPLAAISFAAGFLKKYGDRIDKESTDKKLDKINIQISHITSLLDDVLTIGKADAKLKFKPRNINFYKFLKPLLEEVYMVSKNSHEIKLSGIDNSTMLELDSKLGRNIFINLLTNAIKFSPKSDHILFEYYIENGYLISKITDFGIGIPESELQAVFEPFHRAKNTETIQGTGLGLPIVKEAVEAHGGTIKLQSIPNQKTTFTVKIPLKQTNNK